MSRRENFAEMRALHSSKDGMRKRRESRSRTSAAILSDQDIWHEIGQGNISIQPFHTRNLDHSCYRVTMGDHYFQSGESGEYLNPWNTKRTLRYWEGSYKGVTIDQELFHKCGIPIGRKAIIIPPRSTIIGHTQEFIGGMNFIVAELKGTMKLALAGLTLAGECSWGEIGEITRRPLVIRNTTSSPAVIPVGAHVARIVFYYTGLPKFYLKGETQSAKELDTIAGSWEPADLLPKPSTKKFNIEKIIDPKHEETPRSTLVPSSSSEEDSVAEDGSSEDPSLD